MKIKLRPEQVPIVEECVKVYREHRLLLLFAGTRSGKTIMSLATIESVDPGALVIFSTKKKALKGIKNDIEKACFDLNVVVESVDSLHKIPLEIIEKAGHIIYDECHGLGSYKNNRKKPRWQKARNCSHGKGVILQSATPTPEDWSSLYYQLKLSDRTPFIDYPTFFKWADEFVNIKKIKGRKGGNWKGGNAIYFNDYSEANIPKIEKYIAPYRVTMTQEEAGITTTIRERFITVEMSGYTHKLFNYMKRHGCLQYFDKENVDKYILAGGPAQKLSKLHQICSGTIIETDGGKITTDTSKIMSIFNDVLENGYSKFVVFYNFTQEGDIIKRFLKDELGYAVYEDPYDFEKASSGCFISQIVSGREGIKLASSKVLYMFNIGFAYVSYEQTRNRIQDYNNSEDHELVWMFSDTGLEEDIYKTVLGKQDYTTQHFKKMINRED